MALSLRKQKIGIMRSIEKIAIFLVVAITVLLIYQYTGAKNHLMTGYVELQTQKETYTTWPPFNTKLKRSRDWYIDNCFNGQFSDDLEEIFRSFIPVWSETENEECKSIYEKYISMYEVHERYSKKLTLPQPFYERVFKWLGGDKSLLEQVHHQHLIHVFHPLTSEHTVYNPVRSKRPMPTHETDIFEWVDKMSAESEKDCDFCNYLNMTAVDEFGRHTTKDTARITNTFKVEAWHSMVITRQHHPINISKELMIKLFRESMNWVYDVSQKDSEYIYVNIAWDTLHHAGASQLHPHFHMMISPDHYYGSIELLRSAAQRYFDRNGENYFNVFVEIHAALGLVVEYGNAFAVATLSGKADLEIMLLSDIPGDDLYRLVYFAYNAYHDTFRQLCKSLAGAWPPLGMSKSASSGRIPAIIRLISRGDCTSLRTDVSAYEIFQIVYRIHDPWQVANAIRQSIAKYDN